MSFLPDPAELEAIADRIGRHAAAARARAAHLGSAVAGADWHGLAADSFHLEAHVALSALRSAAGRLDDAADALRRHAHKVGALFDDLRDFGLDGVQTLEDAVLHPDRLVEDGKRLLSDGKDLVGDALDLVGL
ncbi:MAG: hypothetical protein QOC66_3668 [Pseudonocardiales bacterium]|jgi:hypothetical protein|nr:hypothetical protein [Pseudonocardiales bacterium]